VDKNQIITLVLQTIELNSHMTSLDLRDAVIDTLLKNGVDPYYEPAHCAQCSWGHVGLAKCPNCEYDNGFRSEILGPLSSETIKEYTDQHIEKFERMYAIWKDSLPGHENIRADEVTAYLTLWRSIRAQEHIWNSLGRLQRQEICEAHWEATEEWVRP
jgi:hypothetical protein